MAGLFTVKVTLAGATQFTAANPVVTFNEFLPVNNFGVDVVARIIGYSYTTDTGTPTAHDIRLVLTPPNATTGGDEDIVLENRLAANNEAASQFSELCGPDGSVVPRRYGFEATTLPPYTVVANGVTAGATYEMFLSTANKAQAATFYCWYRIDGLDGN